MSGSDHFWERVENLQHHPAYRRIRRQEVDPVQRLLAVVVVRVIRDANPTNRRIKPYYRTTARQFLLDEEGREWLRYFGIPSSKIRPLVENLEQVQ